MLYFKYQLVYYARASGREIVKDYIHSFLEDERSEIFRSIVLLREKEGKPVAPQAKHIFKKIWELRIKYMNHHHRIFYFIKYYIDYLSSL